METVTTVVTIIFIVVALFMVLSILLQAGKGGGLGTALGGGASQTVFGGGGGADVLSRLTQGFAATFMICAIYLAYAAAHSGSNFLRSKSEEFDKQATQVAEGEVDYERIGPAPLRLPTPEEAADKRTDAGLPGGAMSVDPSADPTGFEIPAELPGDELPADDGAPEGDAPEGDAPEGDAPEDDAPDGDIPA